MDAIHSTKIQTGPTGKRGPPQKVDLFFPKLFRLYFPSPPLSVPGSPRMNSAAVIAKKDRQSVGNSCRSFESLKFGELVPRCSRPLPAPRYHAKHGRRLKSKESKLNVFCFSWSTCLLSGLFILLRKWEVSLVVILNDIDCNCQSLRLCPCSALVFALFNSLVIANQPVYFFTSNVAVDFCVAAGCWSRILRCTYAKVGDAKVSVVGKDNRQIRWKTG